MPRPASERAEVSIEQVTSDSKAARGGMHFCACKWIDAKWQATAHGAPMPAIGLAVNHHPYFGEKGSEPFPICEEHARDRGPWWRVYPLPGENEKTRHRFCGFDEETVRPFPDALRKVIIDRFGHEKANPIFDRICWSNMSGCWMFQNSGLTYGLESDGYLHT
jgi:hypothetical protein